MSRDNATPGRNAGRNRKPGNSMHQYRTRPVSPSSIGSR